MRKRAVNGRSDRATVKLVPFQPISRGFNDNGNWMDVIESCDDDL